MTAPVLIVVPPGELIDKITILRIKAERIADPAKRVNVEEELKTLTSARARFLPEDPEIARLEASLAGVNQVLWQIEDDIRNCERAGDFGPRFIELARAVYKTNDRRAALKREINLHLGARLIEEKSYKDAESAHDP
jgi:hypothetical protein